MSAPELRDDLAARRAAAAPRDHRTCMDYDGFVDALTDAHQVVEELACLAEGSLLVTRAELDFTVRRLQVLLLGAIKSAQEAGLA